MRPALRAATSCAVGLACLSVFASDARSQDGQCARDLLPGAPPTEFPLLYPPRHDELTLEAGYVGSSAPVRSAVQSTLMYSFAPADQRLHFGLRAGLTAGNWGADERGPVALGLGTRFGIDLFRPMAGLLATYMFAQGDVLLFAGRGDPVIRPALGAGLRVARAVALEASLSPLVSLGAPFIGGDRVAGGFGAGLSFDFCIALGGFCEERPASTTDEDLTKLLYAEAVRVVPADPGAHGLLCTAVASALDSARYSPHDSVDATEAFLAGVRDNTADATTKAKLEALIEHHRSWRKELLESRSAARTAAADDRSLAEHCIYSPLPMEIRTELGCDPP